MGKGRPKPRGPGRPDACPGPATPPRRRSLVRGRPARTGELGLCPGSRRCHASGPQPYGRRHPRGCRGGPRCSGSRARGRCRQQLSWLAAAAPAGPAPALAAAGGPGHPALSPARVLPQTGGRSPSRPGHPGSGKATERTGRAAAPAAGKSPALQTAATQAGTEA